MSSNAPAVARVAILSPPFAALSYCLPDYLPARAFCIGQRVAAPLGKGLRVGVIVALGREPEKTAEGEDHQGQETRSEKPAADFTLKPLLWPVDKAALLSPHYMDFAAQLARRQGEPLGRVLAGLLPQGLRSAQARIRFFGPGKPRELKLSELRGLEPEDVRQLGVLWMRGRAEVRRAGQNPLDCELCLLAVDPPWPVRPAARAQTALLDYLLEKGPVTRRALLEALGARASATLALLAGRGLVRICPADAQAEGAEEGGCLPLAPPPVLGAAARFHLTPEQEAAFTPLREAALCGRAKTGLLYGITGSGKTAVYLELARAVLNAGRSVMLLAPEVALALKLWNDAKAALPDLAPEQRLLFHGYQSVTARERAFLNLALEGPEGNLQNGDAAPQALPDGPEGALQSGGTEAHAPSSGPEASDAGPGRAKDAALPRLVVGTRSALLLPLENIGLIVLDEEHDASFKQDEGFMYQAKEVAWYRAARHQALLLLGSATPDVKSFYAARQGALDLHVLGKRVGGGRLPEIALVHLPKGGATDGLLAPASLEALRETVDKGEQAVILLNRRGYAPLMYCLSCMATAKCPHCDIALAYHKGRERLICHYCGWNVPYPSPCLACGGLHFLPMGEGTEKLEEGLAAHLPPGTGVLRLDRDSTRRTGRMEAILAAFARKEAQVLVGTQMLSKGHHFPDVTLAVVADADLGLNLPDYRAAERTFQLLLQSAGRAGRGQKPGRVLIQTREPGHYCWDFVKRADYEGFYEQELALRHKRRYPPFVKLALIRISHDMRLEGGEEQVAALGAALRPRAGELDILLLGPAPAPLPFLKGRRRWHCLLKGRDWSAMRALHRQALALAEKTTLRLRLDLDPVNML